jgi:hypothetical protein
MIIYFVIVCHSCHAYAGMTVRKMGAEKNTPNGVFFNLVYVTVCANCFISFAPQNIINVLYAFRQIANFPKHW